MIQPFVITLQDTGPCSAVGNVSDYRCVSDCRSRGREFDRGRSHTFMEIDHEIISTAIPLPSADSRRVVVTELILGCGSVTITLFSQYWPKISSSLRSYFRTVPRFGAFPVILCVFLVILFTFRSL